MTNLIPYFFITTHFWLTRESCKKKFSATNKETRSNVNEFCMIAFAFRSKCTKAFLPSTNISSIIKTFTCWYSFFYIWIVISLGLLYPEDFNPDLTGK